jgi:hypothetical protein
VNIGHSIMARAILVGMERAVRDMRELLREAPSGWPSRGVDPPVRVVSRAAGGRPRPGDGRGSP